jgi:D-arabinose 1-dehydrogenase-like Zn-dependent alcohol dehydrogenase
MYHRDFNFAIPKLPYISGRELSGQVTRIMDSTSRLKVGDRVSNFLLCLGEVENRIG